MHVPSHSMPQVPCVLYQLIPMSPSPSVSQFPFILANNVHGPSHSMSQVSFIIANNVHGPSHSMSAVLSTETADAK